MECVNTAESSLSRNLCEDLKPEGVEKVKGEYEKVHLSCLQRIDQWEKFKKDYEVLKDRLETLPDRISYDIMVPFGSLAFMPGQLIHTNEIMALLGANWFAELSAKHAAEISKRRIEHCEKMLKDLEKEKEQSENWLHYISEVTGGGLVDIDETFDEEKEKLWREQRKKRKAKVNASAPEEQHKDASDTEYFQILENLGEQEERLDELNEIVTSEVDDDDEHSSENNSEEEKKDEDSSDEHSRSNAKHVKWKDQEGEKMKNCITFTHSSRKSKNRSSTKPMSISKTKSKSKESAPLSPVKIQSPSDIYKCFSTKPEQSKPKSILKRRTSVDENDVLTESETECATMKNIEEHVPVFKTTFKEQTAFTGEIVEHEIDKIGLSENVECTVKRPPSRFKAQRQNKLS